MSKTEIKTTKAPAAIGPYSQGVKVGNTIYVSGQIPVSPEDGSLLPNDIEMQTKGVLTNLNEVLKASGATLADVVKTTVFLSNLSNFERFNKVYSGFFTSPYPARACVEVSRLPKGAMVEIEAIAVLP